MAWEEKPVRGRSLPGMCWTGLEQLVGDQDTVCSEVWSAVCTSQKKLPSWGVWFKNPWWGQGISEGKHLKKMEMRKENESYCLRTSIKK